VNENKNAALLFKVSLLRPYLPLSVAAYTMLFGRLAVSTLACRDLRNIGRSR
jgi:hypothetical protein